MEENNKEPEVKVSGKKSFPKGKLIGIISVIAIVAIVAGLIALYVTGHLNLTKKDKVWNSIKKAGESISKVTDDITDKTKPKMADKIFDSSAFEYSAEISADIDEINIEELSSSDKKAIKNGIDILNKSKVNLDLNVDTDEKEFYGKVNAEVDGVVDSISGEVVYKDDTLAVRSEELNEKYLTMSKKYLEKQMGSSFNNVDEIVDGLMGSLKELNLKDDEIKHFKDKYKKVIEKEIKSKKMESSSDKVKINGKQKSCTKVVLSLDEDDIKDLAKKIVETFEDDEKGKEIISKRVVAISKITGNELSDKEVDKYIDQICDEAKDAIDDISFDGKVKITAYATLFNIYRLDIDYSQDGQSAGIQFTFDGKKTNISANVAGQKLGNVTIINDKKKKEFKFELDEDIASYAGVTANADIVLEMGDKDFTTSIDAEFKYKNVEASIKLEEEEERTTDTENELERDSKLTFDIDVPDYVTAKGSLKIKDKLKLVDSISTPKISDSVDIEDTVKTQEYAKEVEKNAQSILNKIKDSELIKSFVNSLPVR
ncbi:MAG: hypothetical protein IKF52_03280 [Clostridia bacterium]|nr:hypothetical protein [Clostridia bacterium]